MKDEKKREFFNNVAIESGVTDIVYLRRIYFGMIRAITKSLADGGIQAPDLGNFKVVDVKARRMHHAKKKVMIQLPARKSLRFEADHKMKEYLKHLI